MKKLACLLALLFAMMLSLSALAEDAVPLEFAFGLFGVEAPAGAVVTHTAGNMFSDFRCEIGPNNMLMYANYASAEEYELTARRKMESCISMMFALSGGADYTETEITEETLANGTKLRWQLMQGSSTHTLWFEAFTADMGYNMVITGDAAVETDDAMLAMMCSFRADAQQELDVLRIRQGNLGNGVFRSAEHGLTIQLDARWSPVTYPDLLLPQTAFVLEMDGGRWLIQLLYTLPVEETETRALLDWYLSARGSSAQPEACNLENLGVEAWVAEEEAGIFMRHIAFVHEGYGYCGTFMWIAQDDVQARPIMDAAIQSIAPAK